MESFYNIFSENLAWHQVNAVHRETITGVGYYLSLLLMLKDADIEPIVVMFHHDLPLALETEYSGFLRLDFLIQF